VKKVKTRIQVEFIATTPEIEPEKLAKIIRRDWSLTTAGSSSLEFPDGWRSVRYGAAEVRARRLK
jgi:hypothetical protein